MTGTAQSTLNGQVGASNRQARFMAGLGTTGAQPHEVAMTDEQLLEAAKVGWKFC